MKAPYLQNRQAMSFSLMHASQLGNKTHLPHSNINKRQLMATPTFYRAPVRAFSYDKKDSDYSKQFESLLNKNSDKPTQTEQEAAEQAKADKLKMDEAQSKQDEIDREKMAEKKAQDFDDLLSGKKQADSEKNLQTLFKEFYSSAKEVDTSKYVNSAKSSLGSLSTKLEERRAKLKKMKQDAMDIDKDKTSDKATDKATETKKDEEEKVDTSKDSSKSKTEDSVKDASKD